MKRKTIISSLVVIGIAALGMQPASAQNFWDTQNYLRQHGSGGNFAQVSNNINVGLNNVQNQLSGKVASGQLSRYEASMLQSRIQEIAAMSRALGRDGRYSTGEVQQLLSEMNQLNAQLSSSGGFTGLGFGSNYATTVGFGDIYNPQFNNFNSVTAYQQQLLNQINSNRYSAAQRQIWRNEYNSFSPYISRTNMNGNYGNNPYLKRMTRLQTQIRDNQRIADRHDDCHDDHNDNHNDNHRNDYRRDHNWH